MLLPVVSCLTMEYDLSLCFCFPFTKILNLFQCSNSAGVPADDRNWPPFFPIIHHDIANEIPVHAQRLQYLAFASWLGMFFLLFDSCCTMIFSDL